MTIIREAASRVGARIGNLNDRHSSHDQSASATLRWRLLNRLAGWLYVRPDRG